MKTNKSQKVIISILAVLIVAAGIFVGVLVYIGIFRSLRYGMHLRIQCLRRRNRRQRQNTAAMI